MPERNTGSSGAEKTGSRPDRAKEAERAADRRKWRKALAEAGAIADEDERARALAEMAEHLPSRQLREALEIAKTIGDEDSRTRALAALAMHVPAEPAESGTPRKIAEFAAQWMSGRWPDRLMMVASLVVIGLIFGGLAWVCWVWWMTAVWEWGFEAFGWKSFVAPLAILYLVIIPFMAIGLFPTIVSFWNEYGALRQQVASARETQRDIERELTRNDPHGLVLMLSYSRAMLNEYYAIAMSQAQRSFRYCLIAMWLGFLVLIAGVLDNFVPLTEILFPGSSGTTVDGIAGQGHVSSDPDTLVLITGVVIEFIAAAFLWVYRFSIQQQTYYYRRQIRLHNALLAHRLTGDMTQAKDESVKMIVERLLEDMEGPATALPDTGVGRLLKR